MALSRENLKYLKNVSKTDRFTDQMSGFLTAGYYDISNYITPDEIPEYIEFMKKWNTKTEKPKDDLYRYMITFTVKDKELPETEEEKQNLEQYIIKQFKRKALKIEEAWIAREYGKENGRIHWHVAVSAHKYIANDRFDYYRKKYGICQIDKNYSQTLKYSKLYISKEIEPTKIIG